MKGRTIIRAALALALLAGAWTMLAMKGRGKVRETPVESIQWRENLDSCIVNAMSELPEMDQAVDSFMTFWGLKGASLAITRNDSLVYAKGYGIADYGQPMTPGTRMRLASVSKLLTAVGIMRLQEEGKVFLIFLGGFFTILINVVDGIRQTDRKLIEVSRSMETPFLKHVALLVIPHSAPNIFTGLRVGLSSCWMCVVAAELVSSTTGLGYMIMNARQFGQTDVVIVGMLTIGVLGKVMDSLLKVVEKAVIRWV